jgi:hypothetical protein
MVSGPPHAHLGGGDGWPTGEQDEGNRSSNTSPPPGSPPKARFAMDSPLEGDGFEPSVPVRRTTLFEPPLSQHARTTAAFENARRPVQQLLLAVVGPVRMNAELTRQLGDRPVPPTAATTTPSL